MTTTESMKSDRRPVWVRSLDAERRQAQAELDALKEGLNELRAYLNSPKFNGRLTGDPLTGYVNVEDVLLRLNEASYGSVLAGEAALR